MRDKNLYFVSGRITADPELKRTPNGNSVTNFTLASNNSYKNKNDEWVNSVTFVDLVVWNGQGEALVDKCRKGDFLDVTSEFTPQSWDDKTTGQKRTRAVFTVKEWRKYDLVKANASPVEKRPQETNDSYNSTNGVNDEEDEDSIPF